MATYNESYSGTGRRAPTTYYPPPLMTLTGTGGGCHGSDSAYRDRSRLASRRASGGSSLDWSRPVRRSTYLLRTHARPLDTGKRWMVRGSRFVSRASTGDGGGRLLGHVHTSLEMAGRWPSESMPRNRQPRRERLARAGLASYAQRRLAE